MEHLSKLSSKYYELVPMSEQKDEVVRPIHTKQNLSQLYQKMD